MMRKFYFLLAALVSVSLMSCNSDDDDSGGSRTDELPSVTTVAGTYSGTCVYTYINRPDTLDATWSISSDSVLTIRDLPVKVLLGRAADSTIVKTAEPSQTVTMTGKVYIYHTPPLAFHLIMNPFTTTATFNGATHSLQVGFKANQVFENGGLYSNGSIDLYVALGEVSIDGDKTNILTGNAGFQLSGKRGNSPIISQ